MTPNKPVRRIAIIGAGVIGSSWTAQYLARGLDVIATDPAPNAEANLRGFVDEAWPALAKIASLGGRLSRPAVFHHGHEKGAGAG
jgi:3-hydroxyacyl-CoA dehydrogenase